MSSSNLLKGFGAGVDVVQQLATDKALRRKTTGTVRGFDYTDGQLIEATTLDATTSRVKHELGRVPRGAVVLQSDTNNVRCTGTALNYVVIEGTAGAVVTLWVV